jgi:hypothetical protein
VFLGLEAIADVMLKSEAPSWNVKEIAPHGKGRVFGMNISVECKISQFSGDFDGIRTPKLNFLL